MSMKERQKVSHETEAMRKGLAIAIDGPVGAGKGTIASLLSEELGGFNLYTGGMYRSLALYCIRNGIALGDEKAVVKALPEVHIELTGNRVFLNGEDVTERIKEEDTATSASIVGLYQDVRTELVRRQYEIAREKLDEGGITVAEGRDIGTRVLPDAALKIFLTARREVRTKRRQEQYREGGFERTFEEVSQEVEERDKRDREREIDPLPSSPEKIGFFVLDNSDMTEEETVRAIVDELKKRKLIDG